MREVAASDKSQSYKATVQKAIQTLFKWRNYERGDDISWQLDMTFTTDGTERKPNNYLTKDERKRLREAAIEYGSIPNYTSLTPDERDKWKGHLAQRFEKPKEDVELDDWERANDYKIASLVAVGLDAGLRASEVEQASTEWVDTEDWMLRIPKGEDADQEEWKVILSEKTAAVLRKWLEQRTNYEKYDDTDALWLTQQGNPYSRNALNYVFDTLCEDAGIQTDGRALTWRSLHHSAATQLAQYESLATVREQLRHESVESLKKYEEYPVAERRDALERMG